MNWQNRVKELINSDIKKEIISKRKSVGNLSAEYGMAKSMIRTILKNKEEIKSAQVVKGISRLSSLHCNITEQMEILLLVWINEKQMACDSVSEAIVCAKARQLFEELSAKAPSTSTGPVMEFCGTKGWFTGFRKRTGLYSVMRHGVAASGDRDKRPATDEPPIGQSPKMSRNDDSSPSTSAIFYDFYWGKFVHSFH